MNIKEEILSNVSFFGGLNSEELKLISDITKEVNYDEGMTIFKEGDKGGSLFLILEGNIKIYKEGIGDTRKVLASLKEKDVFGELSVFDELLRSATAVTSMKSKCLVINSDDLNALMNENHELAIKLLKQVIKTLSNRLRDTNDKLQNNIFWGITAKL